MIKPIIRTTYKGQLILVVWLPSIDCFKLSFGEDKLMLNFEQSFSEQLFSIADKIFTFKLSVAFRPDSFVVGVYSNNVPYKLTAIDILTQSSMSIDDALQMT